MRLRYATLRSLLLVLAFSSFALVASPRSAAAQIELSDDGHAGIAASPNNSAGLTVEENISPSQSDEYGIRAYARGGGYYQTVGVYAQGVSTEALWAIGLYGKADAQPGGYTDRVFGVRAIATGDATSYGIYARGRSDSQNEYAGYFSGDVHVTGNLTEASDRKFKRDIRGLGRGLSGDIEDRMRGFSSSAPGQQSQGAALDRGRRSEAHAKLLRLQPRAYQYRTSEYESMGFSEGQQFGLVAQEVEEVFPEMVSEAIHPGTEQLNEEGDVVEVGEPTTYKSVNYMQLVPVMIQTIREQQAEIGALRERVEALERGN